MESSKQYVYSIWAEWDLGINDQLFSSYQKAYDAIYEAFESCGMDCSVEEAADNGLLSVHKREVL